MATSNAYRAYKCYCPSYGRKSTVIIRNFPSLRTEIYKHNYVGLCYTAIHMYAYSEISLFSVRAFTVLPTKTLYPSFLNYPKINPVPYFRQLNAWLIILFNLSMPLWDSARKFLNQCNYLPHPQTLLRNSVKDSFYKSEK